MEQAITFENVSFSYNSHRVLEDIDLQLAEKDFAGIIGPNGGGKTTMLRLILGFLQPVQGRVTVLGKPPARARRFISYVPQYATMDKDFPIRVRDVVAMGLVTGGSFFPWRRKEMFRRVDEALESVGMPELAGFQFGELSGGQRQRCLVARAIVSRPRILLLDEPTASVDSSAEKDIFELLHSFNSEMTILLVSHDLGFVSSYINKVVCVNRRLVSHPTGEVSFDKVMSETYKSEMTMLMHRCNL